MTHNKQKCKLPDNDLQGLLATILDSDHDGAAALTTGQVHLDVAVAEKIKDGAGDVEPCGGVERGQTKLVGEVHLDVGLLQ